MTDCFSCIFDTNRYHWRQEEGSIVVEQYGKTTTLKGDHIEKKYHCTGRRIFVISCIAIATIISTFLLVEKIVGWSLVADKIGALSLRTKLMTAGGMVAIPLLIIGSILLYRRIKEDSYTDQIYFIDDSDSTVKQQIPI